MLIIKGNLKRKRIMEPNRQNLKEIHKNNKMIKKSKIIHKLNKDNQDNKENKDNKGKNKSKIFKET